MRVAVDGMGGDNSPEAVVKGSVLAAKEYDASIIIAGPEETIKNELKKYNFESDKIKVVNASEVISPNESPVAAIRKKKDSSINKILRMVKDGEADAAVSAGSTGAFMAGSLFIVGRIKGIDRPAISPIIPGKNNPFMLIDCGANVDCKPVNLVQFALMGKVYFESVLKYENPTIGLINNGAEEEKGNKLTKTVYKLLKDAPINFVGNVEPRDISSGDVNILVCDGFVGNTVLKMYEGVATNIFSMLKKEIMSSTRSKIGGLLLKPVVKNFKKKFDYSEYGGAPFVGINGICVKAHGSSDAKAFKNAIKQAINIYDNSVIDKIKKSIENINIKDNNFES